MQDINFEYVRDLVKRRSGLVLQKEKLYLLESRLAPIARQFKAGDVDALLDGLRTKEEEELSETVVEAMTTNETFFFRDKAPFDIFETKVLPYIKKHRPSGHNLRIWSAAASTGQEPYSLRMILEENASRLGLSSNILATDINAKVLKKAKEAKYSQFEVQRGLPVDRLVKYFEKDGQHWVLKNNIRDGVTYQQFNLLDDYSALGKWDVVFCRNVLIYFDKVMKQDVLNRIAQQMAPDGFLFLGSAETTIGLSDSFAPVRGMRSLYQVRPKTQTDVHDDMVATA